MIELDGNNVMVDLETLGTRPGSAILSIGAVRFDGSNVLARFYRRIDWASWQAAGMTVDAGTIAWWLGQTDTARAELTEGQREPIDEVLADFAKWLGDGEVKLWGNGAAFDNALLAEAYQMVFGERAPWNFWNDRCYRTMKSLLPEVKLERLGTAHHALDDAESQARHLMEIVRALKGGPVV
jgi:exodeoxyribonuclease VIII